MVKSLTTSWWAATVAGSAVESVELIALKLLRGSTGAEGARDGVADVCRALHDVHARGAERRHFLRCRTFSTRDDRTGMTHAPSGGRGLPGDEADDGLLERGFDERRGLFFGAPADLADEQDGLGFRIRRKQ